MRHKPEPVLLMPDMASGLPPSDVENSSVCRRPCIRRVLAENHPLELQDGDPALDDLIKLVGKEDMAEFGQFILGGFRMVELLGLIDEPVDQLPKQIVDDLKPDVPVLPLVSTRTKLVSNALVIVALRGLGATICGPYENPIFLKSADRTVVQELRQNLHEVAGVKQVFEDGVWWIEVPDIFLDIHNPENVLRGRTPCPHTAV